MEKQPIKNGFGGAVLPLSLEVPVKTGVEMEPLSGL